MKVRLEGDMKVYNIQSYQNNKTNFTAVKPKNVIPTPISKSVIDLYGLNMETMVGYKGKKTFMPAPDYIKSELAAFMNKLQIDWKTHVTKK